MSINRRIKQKNVQRCVLTGRILNGKDAVLCDNAIEYVKKMGYSVIFTIFDDLKSPTELNYELGSLS